MNHVRYIRLEPSRVFQYSPLTIITVTMKNTCCNARLVFLRALYDILYNLLRKNAFYNRVYSYRHAVYEVNFVRTARYLEASRWNACREFHVSGA